MTNSIIPNPKWVVPVLNHIKLVPYIDYPIVNNATVTEEPFYVEYDFTICSENDVVTNLYKWNGTGWTAVSFTSPEVITTRGFHAVTTSSDTWVVITEHFYD